MIYHRGRFAAPHVLLVSPQRACIGLLFGLRLRSSWAKDRVNLCFGEIEHERSVQSLDANCLDPIHISGDIVDRRVLFGNNVSILREGDQLDHTDNPFNTILLHERSFQCSVGIFMVFGVEILAIIQVMQESSTYHFFI